MSNFFSRRTCYCCLLIPTATQSQAIVRNTNPTNGSTDVSASPGASRGPSGSPGAARATNMRAFVIPRNVLAIAAKMPASVTGRIRANQRSLGRMGNAIPQKHGQGTYEQSEEPGQADISEGFHGHPAAPYCVDASGV